MSQRLLWTLMPVMLVLFLTVFGWFALKAEQLLTSEVEKRLHREATVVRETVKTTYGAYVANEKVLNRALKSMYMQQASILCSAKKKDSGLVPCMGVGGDHTQMDFTTEMKGPMKEIDPGHGICRKR